MSAFEDYCIVCEKACEDGSAYCSDACKQLDQEHSNSPTLSVSSALPSLHGSFSLSNTTTNQDVGTPNSSTCCTMKPHSVAHSNSVTISVTNASVAISPLLTPQVLPRNSIVGSIKSPTLRDLTYESPLLPSSSTHMLLNDLDSNRLDLNSSISERLSESIGQRQQSHASLASNTTTPTSIANLLHTSSEKNYKKWLSIH
jgi:hypothetical protein